jgi:hypothetical protein
MSVSEYKAHPLRLVAVAPHGYSAQADDLVAKL